MKKRFLSILLTLCMVLSLFPVSVAEAEPDPVPSEYDEYANGGDVTVSGLDLNENTPTVDTYYTAVGGYISWEPASNTLTLKNATIDTTIDTTTGTGIGLKLKDGVSTKVVIEGTNNISASSNGISHSGKTSIEGSGTLNIESSGADAIFQSDGDLTITGDVTVIASTTASDRCGIDAQNSLMISGNASVEASGDGADIYSMCNTTIDTTGTVDASKIRALGIFDYKNGTIVGSWVSEGKDDYNNNNVNTIYGSVSLTEDRTVRAASGEDGLTVLSGATLTVEKDVTLTVQDGVEVVNNGTIINNGTIDLPEGTTADEIIAMNITGTGSIHINGSNVTVVNGDVYNYSSLPETSTLDVSTGTAISATVYTAGEGYVLWEPTLNEDKAVIGGTLTLKDATISNDMYEPLITLPTVDVKIVLEGNNTLTNEGRGNDEVALISQGNVEFMDSGHEKTDPKDYALTFDGDGSLEMHGSASIGVFTDGTLVIKGGSFETFNLTEITAVDFKMFDGYLYLNGGFLFLGDAEITGGELYTEGSEKGSGMCIGDFSITGGIVKCGAGKMFGGLVLDSGTLTHSGGTFNATVSKLDDDAKKYITTTYGDTVLKDLKDYPMNLMFGVMGESYILLDIPSNSSLTVPSGAEVRMMGVTPENIGVCFSNEGTLINNGNFILDSGTTADEVKIIAQALNASGTGTIQVNETNPTYYTNSGEAMNMYVGDFDLSSQTDPISNDGYTWEGNSTDGYILTIDSLILSNGNLILPTGVPVTIVTNSNSTINGDIFFSGGYECNLIITGSGELIVNGYISGGAVNGDVITIQDGAKVTVTDSISLGASGGEDGTLIVKGRGTSLNVTGDIAVSLDTLQVLDGADMTVHGDTAGVFAGKGGVTVTGGSTFNVGCEYGVYIIDGQLNVDSTSTLITDATVAPFCIVDTKNAKDESDAVSLPGIPSGTEITSVIGSVKNYTYWSLVNTGDTLGVTDENSEPVTLSGAVIGMTTFKVVKENNSSHSKNYYIITAMAGDGGSINPIGKEFIVSGGSEIFTIITNDGYKIEDVLVDGVSVGAVDSYTFDKVSKSHTISVSFEKILDVFYDDVDDSDWFKIAVDYVTEKGLMEGTDEEGFDPYISTDRGMVATILWRLEGQPSVSSNSDFVDIAQDKYYADAVAWCAENEIVKGYGNGEFGPEDTITREQMAAVLYRYSNFKNYDASQGGMAVREFSDYSQISDWALQSVDWAVNTGIVSGNDNGKLDPQGYAARAQVAMILMRYSENLDK